MHFRVSNFQFRVSPPQDEQIHTHHRPLISATLIYNPYAGGKAARREREILRAGEILRAAGIEARPVATSAPGSGRVLAQAAIREGAELILVCGGDGTVHEVINGVAPSRVPVAVLPGGTANILAKELRLPHSPVGAARALARWQPRRIPLGRAVWNSDGVAGPVRNARWFLSLAGIGFDAYIIHKLSWSFKISWGIAAYVAEAIRQAARYRYPPFRLRLDSRERTPTFAVLNRARHYAGWLPLAPTADIFEPKFSVCLFPGRNPRRYFLYAIAVLLRQHLRLSDVELLEGTRVTCQPLEPGTPIRFELDGELAGELPATFEVVPDALTLLAPSA
jgi:diacylglycerol kinase family enzyme